MSDPKRLSVIRNTGLNYLGQAYALLIGILVGTYSSVFVASPLLLLWQGRARRT